MYKEGLLFSFRGLVHSLTWFLKDCVSYYSAQSVSCKLSNDKDGEMFYAGKADAYEQVLSYLADCSLLDRPDDPAKSGR